MFIKPSLASTTAYDDKAGNAHFTLQSKRKTLFSIRSNDDYRIVLRVGSNLFVIAIDDSFEKIHKDWNWVESNLPPLDSPNIQAVLLNQFEDSSNLGSTY